MGNLVVIMFDGASDATSALKAMRELQKAGAMRLTDTAVVSRTAEGKVEVDNEASSGAEVGAVVGGVIGALTTFFFPLAGAAVGAGAGAWIGSKFNSVDGEFVKQVAGQLEPGKSALFLEIGDGDAAALRAALEPYEGRVYQTNLPESATEQLNKALE